MSPYLVEHVNDSNKRDMLGFLKNHEDFTLFLLNNFENYGFKLTEAPFSGNYKLIRSGEKVVAVFCLTRKGSLLIESLVKEPIFDIVLSACREESISLTGVVGNWNFCSQFWKFLRDRKVIKELYESKDTLFCLDLSNYISSPQPFVRLLTESDYNLWKPLRLAFIKEEGFPNDFTDEQWLNLFREKVDKKIIWGYFKEDRLISTADLNAKASDLGQVGGVYTLPRYRRKGYSKTVMKQLLYDAKEKHHIKKLIIFTGEKNLPALNLYIDLGGIQKGYFALLFGSFYGYP